MAYPPDLFHHGSATLVDAVHDIYSKAAWWATEPIQSKGGTMFPIHKRGSVEDAANFRGLMLLNVLSKTYHKWLRQRVARRLDDIRLDTLLGGFRGQQAAFGAHCIQSVARVAHLCDQPMTCLFVDIQSAYHFLVRELVVGAGESADIASVMANLEIAALNFDLHIEIHRLMEANDEITAGFTKIGLAPFERRGLLLNLGKGKTVAVLAFRGKCAPAFRKKELLTDHPGTWVDLDAQRRVWLHFGTSYKHVGALFVPDGEIPHEVRSRLGQARAAYNSMKANFVWQPLHLCEDETAATRDPGHEQTLLWTEHMGSIAVKSLCITGCICHEVPTVYLRVPSLMVVPPMTRCRASNRTPQVPQRLAVARISYAAKVWSVGPSTLRELLPKESSILVALPMC